MNIIVIVFDIKQFSDTGPRRFRLDPTMIGHYRLIIARRSCDVTKTEMTRATALRVAKGLSLGARLGQVIGQLLALTGVYRKTVARIGRILRPGKIAAGTDDCACCVKDFDSDNLIPRSGW